MRTYPGTLSDRRLLCNTENGGDHVLGNLQCNLRGLAAHQDKAQRGSLNWRVTKSVPADCPPNASARNPPAGKSSAAISLTPSTLTKVAAMDMLQEASSEEKWARAGMERACDELVWRANWGTGSSTTSSDWEWWWLVVCKVRGAGRRIYSEHCKAPSGWVCAMWLIRINRPAESYTSPISRRVNT